MIKAKVEAPIFNTISEVGMDMAPFYFIEKGFSHSRNCC